MRPITAIIPTLNESLDIADAIASVSWCDEIIVADSLSTDNTVQLAEQAGARIVARVFTNYADQKNWAMEQARHDWILLIDADERVTDALRVEIQAILSQDKIGPSGYWIFRKNTFMGRELRYLWQGDKVVRLVRKGVCYYPPALVHEEMVSDGEIATLKASLTHDTYRNKGLMAHIAKGDRYTTLAAIERQDKVTSVNGYHLIIKPIFTFVKHYIFKLGILDGKPGLVISVLSSWNVFMRYIKIWRLHEGENLKP